MREQVLAAARDAGRDPAGITCALHMQAQVGDHATGGPSLVAGPPAAITEQLLAFARTGFSSFSFTLTGPGPRQQAERLAHEVIPAVRAAV
jgi:alkanesulfonate monooxygenase SsuD/methylene tetrahydromethanopterin reductase-like flavin-dependent oxidoreductase (luciferase family)